MTTRFTSLGRTTYVGRAGQWYALMPPAFHAIRRTRCRDPRLLVHEGLETETYIHDAGDYGYDGCDDDGDGYGDYDSDQSRQRVDKRHAHADTHTHS